MIKMSPIYFNFYKHLVVTKIVYKYFTGKFLHAQSFDFQIRATTVFKVTKVTSF